MKKVTIEFKSTEEVKAFREWLACRAEDEYDEARSCGYDDGDSPLTRLIWNVVDQLER